MAEPIFTNNALRKMKQWGLSETVIIDVLRNGVSEECVIKKPGFRQKMKKFSDYEVGVIFFLRNDEYKFSIISAGKRGRY